MLNVVALNGRLTADPELRHTSNDIAVTSFSLAVDRNYTRAGSERQTDFIDIVCWRNTAKFVCKYFRKGQLVAVEGSLQMRTYTDRDGNRRKAVEVQANNACFAEPKRSSRNGGDAAVAPPDVQPPAANSDDDFMELPEPPDDTLPF